MALKIWTGAASTEFNLAGNWTGGVPGAADTALFSGVPTNSPEVFTAGPYAFVMSDLLVTQSYTGHIGATGTPLVVGATNVQIDARLADSAGINVSGSGGELHNVVVRNGIVQLGLLIDDSLNIIGGTVSLVSANLTGASMSVNQSAESPTVVAINAACVLPTTTQMLGGTVTCADDMNNFIMSGGEWTQSDNVTDLDMSGGTFYYEDGTMADVLITGGTFDGSQSTELRTITNLTMHPHSVVNLDDGVGNITVTNPIVVLGGTLKVLPGKTLAVV